MTKSIDLTHFDFHMHFEYRDGALYFKTRKPKSDKQIGDRAGWLRENGYRMIMLDGEEIREHRAIWVMFNGPIPEGLVIDHRDGNPANNLIENLYLVDESINHINSRLRKTSLSGFKGVCWDKEKKKWMVRLRFKNKTHNLGRYETKEDAAHVYDEKCRELFPEIATYNFPRVGERCAKTMIKREA